MIPSNRRISGVELNAPLEVTQRFALVQQGEFLEAGVITGDLETEDVVSLNGSAADMWEALVNEDSEKAALATLSTLYDVDPAALRKDLLKFVDDLRQRRLVV